MHAKLQTAMFYDYKSILFVRELRCKNASDHWLPNRNVTNTVVDIYSFKIIHQSVGYVLKFVH